MGLRIKQAIMHYNENRPEGEPKMNQTSLGKMVLPDMASRTAGWYISQWCDGLNEGKLRIKEIVLIKEITGVSFNFLFGQPDKKA